MSNTNNGIEAFEALKEYMKTNYNAKLASGGKEILKRCHFCGDSRDTSKAHMYIGLKPNGAIVYNCFKCNSSGVVDGKFLRELGCYDPDIIALCNERKMNSTGSNDHSSNKNAFIKTAKSVVIPLSNNEYAQKKLKYISERLGYVFNAGDAARFKIILNLKEFLDLNYTHNYTRQPDIIDLLDKYFIGFLSSDNMYVVLRRLVPEGKLPKYIDYRFVNYKIFGWSDEGNKFYIVPNTIIPYRPLDIHIAEGAFDIISIYLHVAPLGSNAIFGAVCGKSYSSLIRYLIVGYGFTDFNLHLYPDSDIKMEDMIRIKESIKPFGARVFVHRNIYPDQKDYGVSMDMISDSITKI